MASRVMGMLRRHGRTIAYLGIGAVVGASTIPQTLGLSWIKDMQTVQRDGKPVVLSDHVLSLVQKVKNDILLPLEEEAGIDEFVYGGDEPFHKGSVKLKTGYILGLPLSTDYTNLSQIISKQGNIRGTTVDWNTEEGAQLAASYLLSDDAKQFLIAREIHYGINHELWGKSFLRGMFMSGAYAAGAYLTQVFRLKVKMKTWGRVGVYCTISLAFGLPYLLLSDTYKCFKDSKVDALTAKLGRQYAEGGVEYYTKTLQRNLAFRKLLGREGEANYTAYGNPTTGWRTRNMAPVARRDSLIRYLKEYDQK